MMTRDTVINVPIDRVITTIPASHRNNTAPATGNIFSGEARARIQTQQQLKRDARFIQQCETKFSRKSRKRKRKHK